MTEQEEFEFRHRLEQEQASAKPAAPSESVADKIGRSIQNTAAGLVRGAGSIGATILTPVDAAARAVGVQNDFIGRTDRRQAMDEGLRELGADPNSVAYQVGKVGGEVAGTAGVGSVLAGGARLAGAAAPVVSALQTGGLSAGGVGGLGGVALRSAAGAAVGGTAASLANPADAAAGTAIGAALPGVLGLAGRAGQAVGRSLRGPGQSPEAAAVVQAARDAGYVIPPTQANPSLLNRALEGTAGKISTAQNASARNQSVTTAKVVEDLGLPEGTKLTDDVYKQVRQSAGNAYNIVKGLGTVQTDAQFAADLANLTSRQQTAGKSFPGLVKDDIENLVTSLNQKQFDAEGALSAISYMREKATEAYAKQDKSLGKAYRSASDALEDQLDRALSAAGNPDALQAFRDARTLIAKTYTAEAATNKATGSVDARKLGAMVNRGKPVSGGMRQAADFANAFPKAAQTVEGMGSLPQFSPLDLTASLGMSAVTANPLMMAGMAIRPGARAVALSPVVQNRLAQAAQPAISQPNALMQLLEQGGYRTAPLLGGDR